MESSHLTSKKLGNTFLSGNLAVAGSLSVYMQTKVFESVSYFVRLNCSQCAIRRFRR